MDLITLAMAKAYSDSQRLAYTTPLYHSFRFNGDLTGKDTFDGALLDQLNCTFVRVSGDTVANLDATDAWYHSSEGPHHATPMGYTTDDGICMVLDRTNRIMAVSLPSAVANAIGVAPGIYFYTKILSDGSLVYTSAITGPFKETIHPIDPKFIPGAVLPVVEITTEPTEEGAPLTEAECAMLNEVAKTAAPIVVRSMGTVCCASYMGAVGVDDVGYTFNFMRDLFVLQRVEGGSWVYITAPLEEVK